MSWILRGLLVAMRPSVASGPLGQAWKFNLLGQDWKFNLPGQAWKFNLSGQAWKFKLLGRDPPLSPHPAGAANPDDLTRREPQAQRIKTVRSTRASHKGFRIKGFVSYTHLFCSLSRPLFARCMMFAAAKIAFSDFLSDFHKEVEEVLNNDGDEQKLGALVASTTEQVHVLLWSELAKAEKEHKKKRGQAQNDDGLGDAVTVSSGEERRLGSSAKKKAKTSHEPEADPGSTSSSSTSIVAMPSVMIVDVGNMTCAQLRDELKEFDWAPTGSKAVLMERVRMLREQRAIRSGSDAALAE